MRPTPITVTQLNSYIKKVIDQDEMLNYVYIKGEISNFKNHYSGHMYFTLKDETSLIKCVMFKTYTGNLQFEPKDGMSVVILGSVSVFERDGNYQIYVKGMEPDGMGALYTAYEQLKEKLEKEGLFDSRYKKKIPQLPKAIGVVTSQTGAVIRDIINVTTRRFPNVNIKLYPAAVQGSGAAETIVKAIKKLNEQNKVDVIIIARGGGSLEDLWPFNEEITARAIFESKIPIISAVGHETDFTISDFVADLRAPTPSAAGELAVPDKKELLWKIQTVKRRCSLSLNKKVEGMRIQYGNLRNRRVLKEPYDKIRQNQLTLDHRQRQLLHFIQMEKKRLDSRFSEIVVKLDSLSPLKTLARGYCLTMDQKQKIVKEAASLNIGDEVTLIFQDGRKEAKIIGE